ncbi:MAG TPA: DUF1549 domain-containing protein, partial [Gemmataceae bacterium]|nr:DUF1549 domain-containing protein [Gemmataceae bacterium]
GSWQYRVLHEWLRQGAKWSSGQNRVRRLQVSPQEHLFQRPGETVQLTVTVEFDDGSREDMTPFCDFRVKDDSIVEVSATGLVRAQQPGDTAIVISYRGNIIAARAMVPVPQDKGFVYPTVTEANYVDRDVFAKLRRLNMTPSQLSADAEFLRRVTIDTIGCLPSPPEVRAFLADQRANKRAQKIEELLCHPLHAALWATKLSDITGNNVDVMEDPPELRFKRAKMWHDWFRKRIAANMPYDDIVHGVLCATSRDGMDVQQWMKQELALDTAAHQGFEADYASRYSLDLFWRRADQNDFFPLEKMAELTATAFLGIRIECAQCHKHPFDRWSQSDYRAYANVFAQTRFGSSLEVRAATEQLIQERRQREPSKAGPPVPRLQEIYVSNDLRRLQNPETNRRLSPKALGGPELDYSGDCREKLFQWLVRPDNPFFARSFVNRVWAMYFGVGLVEPVDNFSVANPPSNERLLDALARDFIDHRFDIRHLERTILMSRTYQLSAVPNTTNRSDHKNFSHANPRRLMAEVVVDVLNSALDVTENFGREVPPGIHAIEIAPNRIQNPDLASIFRIFGRPPRTAACDCERSMEPAVPQTLFTMIDENLMKKIKTGRLQKLLASRKTDESMVEELFLATLSRFPNDAEKLAALNHVKQNKDRPAGFVDVVWALINTREFILNH